MKEYQFQYTKMKESLIVITLTIIIFMVFFLVGLFLKLNIILFSFSGIVLSFLFFRKFKEKAVFNCNAKLNENSITFFFENETKQINFYDLISYKFYNGKNGPILYLNSNKEKFKIYSNVNYCDLKNFNLFCENVMFELNKFKEKFNNKLIHEGSIYATRGMLLYLIIGTIIYLIGFIFETRPLILGIGFGGGFYFLIMWLTYFSERKNKST